MKFNRLTLSLPFFAVLLFSSCKKNDVNENGNSNRVKTYIEDASATPYRKIDTFNLSYDGQGRIISMTAQSSGGSFTYQYNPGNIVMDIKNGSYLIIRQYTYLNSNQLVDSSFQFNDTNDSTAEKYLYDATGTITSRREYSGTGMPFSSTTFHQYDAAGNLVMDIDTDAAGDTVARKRYDHSTALNTNYFQSNLQPYLPRLHKNLVSRETNLSPDGTIEYSYADHTYSFDDQNRVVTETVTDSYGNVVVKKYTYY